jgi:hypothetical protein
MGAVNSRGERRSSERDFEPTARTQGAQTSAKNGRIPGLQRPDQPIERVSPEGVLADGEDSNSRYPSDQNCRVVGVSMNRLLVRGAEVRAPIEFLGFPSRYGCDSK